MLAPAVTFEIVAGAAGESDATETEGGIDPQLLVLFVAVVAELLIRKAEVVEALQMVGKTAAVDMIAITALNRAEGDGESAVSREGEGGAEIGKEAESVDAVVGNAGDDLLAAEA